MLKQTLQRYLIVGRFSTLAKNELCEAFPIQNKTSVLDTCKEDLSHIAPYLRPTFNFASYINKSTTLQELLKLGVKLYKIERNIDAAPFILSLNFESNIKNHVTYLHDHVGLSIETVGAIITKNPFIFRIDLDDIKVRVNYLTSKRFTEEMIVRILSVNAEWLNYSTKEIDDKLGFFQKHFTLTGNEVRALTVQQPKLITFKLQNIQVNSFAIKEEMGFNDEQRKIILLKKPNIFMKDQNKLLQTFEYLHNEMMIPLEVIVEKPEVLTCRSFRLKQRHQFLEKLGKIQFNPKEPSYISICSIVSGTDVEFCSEIAKCPIEYYNTFLKTL